MKKAYIFVAVILIIIIGVVLATRKKSTTSTSSTKSASSASSISSAKKVDACAVFTLADAQSVLGVNAKKTEGASANTESSTARVSTCNYNDGSASADEQTVTILARSSSGNDVAKNAFEAAEPDGAQTITGYGDAAYYSSSYGQFDVVKNNVWLIISAGPSVPSQRDVSSAEQVAKIALSRI
ncbi:MAG: hypothetical protein ABI221_01955 [Candidatus Saccharimonadales bacterium]